MKDKRDLERAVQSFYNWAGISRRLFQPIIFKKRYYKEWRDLEKAAQRYYISREIWRDIEKAVQSSYI